MILRWALVAGAAALLFLMHLTFGTKPLSFGVVWQALTAPDPDSFQHRVVLDLRLPRALAAMLAGAALAVAGALMQGLTRNPLADPFLLGLSSGAGLAVVAMGLVGVTAAMPVIAAIGAMVATAVTLGIASRMQGGGPLGMTLAGAVVTALLQALILLAQILSSFSFEEYRIWLTGSLAGRDMAQVWLAAPWIVGGVAMAWMLARRLTAMSLGQDAARGLGVNIRLTGAALMVAVTVLTAAAVLLVGPLGFVGLVIPHVARLIAGADYRVTVPLCAIIGAGFLLGIDTLARVVVAPQELSTGVLSALIGAPVFVALVRRGVR